MFPGLDFQRVQQTVEVLLNGPSRAFASIIYNEKDASLAPFFLGICCKELLADKMHTKEDFLEADLEVG